VLLIIIACAAYFKCRGKKTEEPNSPLEQSESKIPIHNKNDGVVIVIETPERPSIAKKQAAVDIKDVVLDFTEIYEQKGGLDLRDPHSTPQTPEDIESESKFGETKRIKLDY